MSPNTPNLHIATDDSQADDVGSPEFVSLAAKLSTEHIDAVGVLHKTLYNVREANLGADAAVKLLGDHINTLVAVFEATVPLIQRALTNYDKGNGQTLGSTAAAKGIQGVLGSIIGPSLLNLSNQLPILQGFLETVKGATFPRSPKVEILTS